MKLIHKSSNKTEICCIKITNIKEPINIIAFYRSPNVNLCQIEWDIIISNTEFCKNTIFVGDFNAHNEIWNCDKNDQNGSRLFFAHDL